ncbi:carboxypeptidase regulatory-like domain-containing protein [Candidatus Palauibacter sp.]|uniref:TonB-dependent receptor n=1 Tax=Candidatus Palauibacter sp. TaxID=3101350 RepID=UPI003B01402A
MREEARSDGQLVLCAPRDAREATLWAEFGDASSEETVIPIRSGEAHVVELALRLGSIKTGRLIGQVRDMLTDKPVVAAAVSVADDEAVAETSRSGGFVLSGVPVGEHELSVRHMGYAHLTHSVTVLRGTTTEVEIGLSPDPVKMAPLVATATRSRRLEIRGFYERQHWGELVGGGTFLTAEDIERRNPNRITHMIAETPGIRLGECGFRHNTCKLFSSRLSDGFTNTGCQMNVYLNNTLVIRRGALHQQPLNDLVLPGEIDGIEVYRGASSVPGEFAGSDSRCGVVVIWTK